MNRDSRAHNLALQKRRNKQWEGAQKGMTREDFWKLDEGDRGDLRYRKGQQLSTDQSLGFAGAGRADARQREMDRWMGQRVNRGVQQHKEDNLPLPHPAYRLLLVHLLRCNRQQRHNKTQPKQELHEVYMMRQRLWAMLWHSQKLLDRLRG